MLQYEDKNNVVDPPPPPGLTNHTLTTTDLNGQEMGVRFPVQADSFSPMQPKLLWDPRQQLYGPNESPVQWYHTSVPQVKQPQY
jgi:hypothetical protein